MFGKLNEATQLKTSLAKYSVEFNDLAVQMRPHRIVYLSLLGRPYTLLYVRRSVSRLIALWPHPKLAMRYWRSFINWKILYHCTFLLFFYNVISKRFSLNVIIFFIYFFFEFIYNSTREEPIVTAGSLSEQEEQENRSASCLDDATTRKSLCKTPVFYWKHTFYIIKHTKKV